MSSNFGRSKVYLTQLGFVNQSTRFDLVVAIVFSSTESYPIHLFNNLEPDWLIVIKYCFSGFRPFEVHNLEV